MAWVENWGAGSPALSKSARAAQGSTIAMVAQQIRAHAIAVMFRTGLRLRIRKSSAMTLPYKRRLRCQSSALSELSNNDDEYRRALDKSQSLLATAEVGQTSTALMSG